MKKILIAFIIASGIFQYKILGENRFYPAQYAFFIFGIGILGSCLLYTKNKWMGCLAGLCSVMFLKTYLFQHAPRPELINLTLVGSFIFITYYISRQINLKEDILKWFLIPAVLNSVLIIIQSCDHNYLSFLPVEGVTGFLGNIGVSACFVALTIPICLKYFRKGLPILLLAIILSKCLIALIICVVSGLFYLRYENKRRFAIAILVTIIILSFSIVSKKESLKAGVRQRLSMYAGTLDGIKHNPILGWGIGSFEPIMNEVTPEESVYLGVQFNYKDSIMNHPHNEILFGWWNCGILFPIFFILFGISLIRKFLKDKVLSFSIIIAGFINMMGYFLSLPSWLLIMISLGIYENRGKNVQEKE